MSSWSPIPPIDAVVAKCIALNEELIDQFGGSHTVTPPQVCLEKAIAAATNAELYAGNEDASGLCFMGALMFYLIKDHCFLDGNKRTGLAIMLWLLMRFGLTLNSLQEDVRDFCLAIASGTIKTREEVVFWIAEHIVAIEPEQ